MVTQAFKVDVEVLAAARGCTAVLRCVVPSFVKDLVRVVSWVQEPTFYIYPSLQGGRSLPYSLITNFYNSLVLCIHYIKMYYFVLKLRHF